MTKTIIFCYHHFVFLSLFFLVLLLLVPNLISFANRWTSTITKGIRENSPINSFDSRYHGTDDLNQFLSSSGPICLPIDASPLTLTESFDELIDDKSDYRHLAQSITTWPQCIAKLSLDIRLLYEKQRKAELDEYPSLVTRNILVGFGGCLDSIVRGTTLLTLLGISQEALSTNYPFGYLGRDHDEINTEEDIFDIFTYFFSHGAAGERYVADKTLWSKIVSSVVSLHNADPSSVSWNFGGNAAHFSTRLIMEGHTVTLGAYINDIAASKMQRRVSECRMRKTKSKSQSKSEVLVDDLFDQNPLIFQESKHSTNSNNNNNNSSLDRKLLNIVDDLEYKNEREMDIHVILEFPVNEEWFGSTSPRANRLILHSDVYNPTLTGIRSMTELGKIEIDKYDMLVLGGFQMMDAFKYDHRDQRLDLLKSVKNLVDSFPRKKPIHIELASFTNYEFVSELYQLGFLLGIDSIGMNEQELSTLYSFLMKHEGTRLLRATNARPKVRNTLELMRHVWRVSRLLNADQRRLERIHVHTIAFQAGMVAVHSKWTRNENAMSKASLVAFRHTCGLKPHDKFQIEEMGATLLLSSFAIDDNDPDIRRYISNETGVACWEEIIDGEAIQFCVSPNITCTKVISTVAAGDNISAAALGVEVGRDIST